VRNKFFANISASCKPSYDLSPYRCELSGNQAAAGRVHRIAVEDLVLGQEDKPKGTDQLIRFRMKLSFPVRMQ